MIYKVQKEATWLQPISNEILKSENFNRIVKFFVLESIVEGTSARGKSLIKDYQWSNPWAKPYYLNRQLKQLSTDRNLLFSASIYEQKKVKISKKLETMDEALDKANLKLFPETSFERICIYNSKKNQIISTFAHIRNSFAHCRFNILEDGENIVYCFEDVDPNKDSQGKVKVSGRIVLFESTLLKWIDLIEAGEHEYTSIVEP